MQNIAKLIIFVGAVLIGIGLLVLLLQRLGIHVGRLPGDIVWRKGNTTIYIPIATSILLSLLLTLLLWIFRR